LPTSGGHVFNNQKEAKKMTTNRNRFRSLAAIAAAALVAWIGSDSSRAGGPAKGELAAPVKEPASPVRKIFVPRPKDAGDTLDESSGSAAADQVDVVTTVLGDRLLGSVVRIAAGGKLQLTGEQFEGEVQVDVGALDGVVLRSSDKDSGDDEVALTNGDRIIGQLSTIAPDGILIETQAAGQLRISPKVVRSITFSKGASVLAESNFPGGNLEPWQSRGGSWTVSEGALVCRNRGSGNALFVKLEQKEAVTLVAKVQSLEGSSFRCDLVLFADTTEGVPNEGRYGRNSLFAMFQNSEYYLMCVNNGSTNSIVNRNFGRQIQNGTLRLAYDPATGKAALWLDSAELGQYDVPTKTTSGQYVMFNSYFPLKVEYLTVYRGIVPPRGDDDGAVGAAGTADEATVQFANKDRVSVASITLAEGEITFRTTYGELKCPVANVERILFGKKAQEEPRRRKDDIRVRTSAGRMTIQFDRLTADSLVGQSEFLGEVKLRRSAVREIKFNPYR
jgi:hypothetical protein